MKVSPRGRCDEHNTITLRTELLPPARDGELWHSESVRSQVWQAQHHHSYNSTITVCQRRGTLTLPVCEVTVLTSATPSQLEQNYYRLPETGKCDTASLSGNSSEKHNTITTRTELLPPARDGELSHFQPDRSQLFFLKSTNYHRTQLFPSAWDGEQCQRKSIAGGKG